MKEKHLNVQLSECADAVFSETPLLTRLIESIFAILPETHLQCNAGSSFTQEFHRLFQLLHPSSHDSHIIATRPKKEFIFLCDFHRQRRQQ